MTKIHSLYINCLFLSIVFCGLSVSFSQIFLFLTFIFYLFDKKEEWRHSWILYLSIFLALSYLASFWVHLHKADYSLAYVKKAWSGELKDLFLFLGLFVMQNVKKTDEKKIYRAFWILACILLFTGFLSIFTSVRLNKIVSELYTVTKTWRYTHYYGVFSGINLYLPVGLMSTHLTFGGLLGLFLPLFCFKFIFSFQHRNHRNTLIFFLLLLCFCLVFALNNARSAIFGSVFSILFAFFHLFFIKRELPKKYLKWGLPLILVSLIFVGFTLSKSDGGKKVLYPLLGQSKHTDSGRTFIWHSTFELIKSNFWFGVGPNNYNDEIQKMRDLESEAHPSLLYFFQTIPKGHAHNDFFHMLVCFGIFSLILFIWLIYRISVEILNSNLNSSQKLIYFYGLVGFFVGSLFQCYFQDDEVVIVFWLLLGLLVRSISLQKHKLAKL